MRLFSHNPTDEAVQLESALDLVTYAAGLASNPADIDTLLDGVRALTSRMVPGKSLSGSDEQALIAVYLKLERYLTTDEPIRTFTRDKLRANASASLLFKINKAEKGTL